MNEIEFHDKRRVAAGRRTTDRLYHLVAQTIPAVVFIANLDGLLEYVSERWFDLFGKDAVEIGGFGWRRALHPADFTRLRASWRTLSREGDVSCDARLRPAEEQSYRWFAIRATVIREADGKHVGWIGTAADIDERKRAEARLMQTEVFTRHLLASTEDSVSVLDCDGRVVWTIENTEPQLALASPREAGHASWIELWEGENRVPADLAVAAARGGAVGRFQALCRTRSNEPAWWDVVVTPINGATSATQYLLAVSRNITKQRSAEAVLTKSVAVHRALTDALPQIVWTAAADGALEYVNHQFTVYTGYTSDESLGTRWNAFVHPIDLAATTAAWQRSVASGTGHEHQYRLRRAADGMYRWQLSRAIPIRDERGNVVKWFGTTTDIHEQKRAEEEQSFLAHASRLLADSLDLDTTLTSIARLCVPDLARWCRVDLLEEDGQIRTHVIAHAERRREHEAQSLLRSQALDATQTVGVSYVVRTGFSQMLDAASDALAASDADFTSDAAVYEELGIGGAMIVPLVAHARVLGAITFVSAGSNSYTNADVRFAEEVARRAALSLEHARRYARELAVATTFQQASLSTILPDVPGLVFNAVYVAGKNEANVGGDWYDAFMLPDGGIGISIGDVVGSGLKAAVTMGKLRQAMQSVGMLVHEPRAMLDAADLTLRLNDPNGTATALAAVYDPKTRRLTYASAGHPLPLVRRADATFAGMMHAEPPLGLRTAEHAQTSDLVLAPNDIVVFYTDGLIESTRDLEEGERCLREVLVRLDARDGQRLARLIFDGILGDVARDDVAILTLALIEDR